MSTVGLDEEVIREYIKKQEDDDRMQDEFLASRSVSWIEPPAPRIAVFIIILQNRIFCQEDFEKIYAVFLKFYGVLFKKYAVFLFQIRRTFLSSAR